MKPEKKKPVAKTKPKTEPTKEPEFRPGRNGGKLKIFPKGGASPNPSGRPAGTKNRKTIMNEILSIMSTEINPLTGNPEKMTQFQHMYISMVNRGKLGDTQAFNAAMDRVDGKPKQTLSGDPDAPLIPDNKFENVTTDDLKKLLAAHEQPQNDDDDE